MEQFTEILKKLNISEFTAFQKRAINTILKQNVNVVISAKTGIGKTFAYLVPLYLCLKREDKALILCPTTELCLQTALVFERLFAEKVYLDAKKPSLSGKQIFILTPKKATELIKIGAFNQAEFKFLVADEADFMFEVEFMEELNQVFTYFKKSRFILVSATVKKSMKPFIKAFFGSFLMLEETNSHLNLKHYIARAEIGEEIKTLVALLKAKNPYTALVFVSKKVELKKVYEEIVKEIPNSVLISGNLDLKERQRIYKELTEEKYSVVVATDLFSRGIDLNFSHIFNLDVPKTKAIFEHRQGRTARFNRFGEVYTIYTDLDKRRLYNYQPQNSPFIELKVKNNEVFELKKPKSKQSELIIAAVKSVKKPTKVKPNYKKQNKKAIEKAVKAAKVKGFRAQFKKGKR